MSWFDPPAITLRKRVPSSALSSFNNVEEFTLYSLQGSSQQLRPYQLGMVLALWIKAGEITGALNLSRGDSRKVQSVYVSCMKVLKKESLDAFLILTTLAEQEGTFGIPPEFYRQLSANVSA
ncbi:hypothetical protein [Pararhizobium sp.]|uniref:hypothetical protein n=1 Tax=Pararhizobium sp. TaxID=1977563 RepID=UPI00271EA5F9|nr:hypothetical protein [Pararhizobium sp.]MDO9414508.1 hypothetical protein [Pararhizobium sp.]